jgi:polyhydroxyalkanoate synthesis regulator phasin
MGGEMQAANVALVGAGNALQGVGEFIGRFAQQKQEQVNKGLLASEETIRMETAAQIEEYAAKNQGTPETWGKFRADTWKAYETGKTARQKEQGWGPAVVAQDKMMTQSYVAETGIRFNAQQSAAQIRQSNSRLMANAQTKLRSGDYEGYVAAVEQMNLAPDQKEPMIRSGLEEGLYKIASNQLDAIRELPPAQAIDAYNRFTTDLKEKDGKTYKNYEFEAGGLSLGGRVNLESMTNARVREAQRQMDVNGRRLVSEIRLGRATSADVEAALKAGDMDVDTAKMLEPDMIQAAEERAGKVAAKAQETAQQQAAKADRIRTAAVTPDKVGTVGTRDIEKQIALGEISPEQGRQLQEELMQAAKSEQGSTGGAYAKISEKIKGGFGAKMFGRQPSDKEYRDIQADIIGAKLTKETRLKLVDELFTLKLADIEDLQEEGTRWADRDITATERGLRRDMIGEYRRLAPALGDVLAGDLMLNQETRIREFFDTAKDGNRSPDEVKKFLREDLLPEAQKAAGYEALKSAFDY